MYCVHCPVLEALGLEATGSLTVSCALPWLDFNP